MSNATRSGCTTSTARATSSPRPARTPEAFQSAVSAQEKGGGGEPGRRLQSDAVRPCGARGFSLPPAWRWVLVEEGEPRWARTAEPSPRQEFDAFVRRGL